ncbi:MAG: hypothetical protein E7452_09515 [Ruminococcaceae bacterium]|nr:hypothetical protein [Oscillospiraceae bacterium]
MTPTIRKRLTVFLALSMLLSLLSGVVAAVGSMDDPLITKSYIENTFFGELSAVITNRVSEADQLESPAVDKLQTIRDDALDKISLEKLADLAADALWSAVDTQKFSAPAVNHQRQIVLSPGDTLNALPGATVKVLSGRVQTRNGVGATVVQIASAKELYNQWELSEGDYLLVTELGAIGFTPILGNATIMVTGEFLIEHGEPYTAQFTDLADALNKMGLFLGSGKGYELDRVSRRDEGLIMLLRLLGDEAAALELAEVTHPFTDVYPWAADYVSFAYANGLTNGTSATEYSSMMLIEPEQYMTFLLRALGYSDSGVNPDFFYKTAIDSAVEFGVISQAEAEMLTATPLYRDKMVYISYYGLFAKLKGTNTTLIESLIEKGAVDEETAHKATVAINRVRP